METLLDVLQFVLFLFFLVAGGAKLIWAREGFNEVLPYAEDFSDTGFKQLGLVELIAALGLAISLATDTPDWVAPVSALLLAGLQITVGVLSLASHRGPAVSADDDSARDHRPGRGMVCRFGPCPL